MERYIEKLHPILAEKKVLFVDHSIFTNGFVRRMSGLERMKVHTLNNLLSIPNLTVFMEQINADFTIIHSASLGELDKIIDAFRSGKTVVVQEKSDSILLNREFNQELKKVGVKTFSRTEPDLNRAFEKCLDYLATCVSKHTCG